MSSDGETYCRQQRLPFRKLDDQTVILNPRQRDVHVLNGTGSLIWELLERRRSVDELVALLHDNSGFTGEKGDMARDVAAFLAELTRKGLVVTAGPETEGRP